MVKEAEIARFYGYLSDGALGRLVRCLQSYGLPISVSDTRVKELMINRMFDVKELLTIMGVDKKTVGSKKKIVLLAGIGKTVEKRALNVDDEVIELILSDGIRVHPLSSIQSDKEISLAVPGSKSISNRCLVMAALGTGECRIKGLLHSDDTQVMLTALQKLVGCDYIWEQNGSILVLRGGGGKLTTPVDGSQVYLGNAGTAARFLTSVCALIPFNPDSPKTTIVTGNARMKQRPIGPLVSALRENGVVINYLSSEGCLPLEITASGGLNGGVIELSANISSQYVSSILISAPYAQTEVTLRLVGGRVVSQPYIDMTIAMMRQFGIEVERVDEITYRIPKGVYRNPLNYLVEADASSATYPLAFAAITGSKVHVNNMGSESLQGDARFAIDILQRMGCEVTQTPTTTTVQGPGIGELRALGEVNMEPMTDAFLTASVLAAVACQPSSEGVNVTKIRGIANQRVKECNRIKAMVDELGKFGVVASELDDGIMIHGKHYSELSSPDNGVHCYDDHRVAMSFSVLSCVVGNAGTVIREKKCVEKTWPGWWDTLQNTLGMKCSGVDIIDSHSITKPLPKLETNSIVLIGMRGVGKTHCGRALAQSLSKTFIDMDTYFETTTQSTIPSYISQHGWESFRAIESELLQKVLITEHATNAVISCGGGVIESEQNRQLLKSFPGLVIHLRRDMKSVAEYLDSDPTRPSVGDDVLSVWKRREPGYKACCRAEFFIVPDDNSNGEKKWSVVNNELIKMTKEWFSLEKSRVNLDTVTGHPTFFLSLTLPDYSSFSRDEFDRITEGVDAIELRADLLNNTSLENVGKQVTYLRRLSQLPIIYTVRTISQGGAFPDDDVDSYVDLVTFGMKLGCEFVDVEVTDSTKSRLETITKLRNETKSLIIASYHDKTGVVIWDDRDIRYDSSKNLPKHHRHPTRMRDKLLECLPFGDIIKLIGKANSMRDNWSLEYFRTTILPSLHVTKPVIALNMGSIGQVSRALNTVFTPVTHRLLPKAAAPGQLSVQQIHQIRYSLGLLPAKDFFLFGEPIQQSMSPTLHNTGFTTLGLPHTYHLYESSDWQKVAQIVSRGVADGTFGGASVTIPLKQDMITHGIAQRVTEHATKIGAVNTLSVKIDESSGDKIVVGDNTDWLGIRKCILGDATSLSEQFGDANVVGIVIGAGGTSRAAIYALQSLQVGDIRIWNRTASKAVELGREFGIRAVGELKDVFTVDSQISSSRVVYVVIGTIPAPAQDGLSLASLFNESFESETPGVVVELAYRPRITPLLSAAAKKNFRCVQGIDILIEQGFEQFSRWTDCVPPRAVMKEVVYNSYH